MSLILATSPSDQISLARYLEEIKRIPSLDAETEFMLAKDMIEHKDIKAAHKLVLSYLKLVPKIARVYKNYGLPMIEMISEGNIGLMQAVKKFNPELGYRLSTYATWWIKAAIQEYIIKSWSLVKIGTTSAQKKLFFNLRKLKSKITKLEARSELNHEDIKKIAAQLNVHESEVIEMDQRIHSSDISLNNFINEDKNEAIDLIPESRPNQEVIFEKKQEKKRKLNLFHKALALLDVREKEIIEQRHLSENALTLEQIAKKFNVSTERVRQLETRALNKLKEAVANN
ncbi:MAG: RNA polymerase sigma factor RpoH [Sphingobacteriia bacterium]|nr:RNA polymerase sigma factor RpoH [Sphingobacteriia bacterium]